MGLGFRVRGEAEEAHESEAGRPPAEGHALLGRQSLAEEEEDERHEQAEQRGRGGIRKPDVPRHQLTPE